MFAQSDQSTSAAELQTRERPASRRRGHQHAPALIASDTQRSALGSTMSGKRSTLKSESLHVAVVMVVLRC